MATAVSENVDEFLAAPPEELAVKLELVPCSNKYKQFVALKRPKACQTRLSMAWTGTQS